jgi:hypothetical protein
MEPEISLPYSQVPATCPYPQPAPSSPHSPLPPSALTPGKYPNRAPLNRRLGGPQKRLGLSFYVEINILPMAKYEPWIFQLVP